MPRKADESLRARHVIITGGTGSGKSTVVKNNQEIKKAQIVVFWDPDETHGAHYCRSVIEFGRALSQGIKSGKKIRLGLAVEATEENFQKFCRIVWGASCASRPIVCVVEELHEVTGSGQARGMWKTLLNRGRKFAVMIVAISQRPQEIDKTTLSQCGTKITGLLDREKDRKVISEELGVTVAELRQLNAVDLNRERHYYMIEPGQVKAKLVINRFKK